MIKNTCIACLWWEVCACDGENKIYTCPKAITVNDENYMSLRQAYDEDVEQALIPVTKYWKVLFNDYLNNKISSSTRKYIAVSIKHSEHGWKVGSPLYLWGYKQTADNEDRCFAMYTMYLDEAERYCLGDFTSHGFLNIKDDEPVKICTNFCKKYKEYDTVLIDTDLYLSYCKVFDIPTSKYDSNDTDCKK